jgi:hypothetical protein
MARSGSDGALEEFLDRLRHEIAPYAGLVEYGNLRSTISDWENASGGRITNVAIVYETPGGSTDQINVSFDHRAERFSVVDEVEVVTAAVGDVLGRILPRIHSIPAKRFEALTAEIRRQIDEGVGRAGLFGHINRLTQSDFKGGTITHQELKDAMQFAIKYLREKDSKNRPDD